MKKVGRDKIQANKATFIEEARRKQILATAIKKINLYGYEGASIQKIAKEIGVSKGVIYYHFKGQKELISSIWETLFKELSEYRKARVETQKTARTKLKTYIESNVEFHKAHHNKIVTLLRIGLDIKSIDSKNGHWSHEAYQRCFDYLSEILEKGQKNREFRNFSTKEMAHAIQSAIEGLLLQWIQVPELFDFDAQQKMLLDIIERYVVAPE